MDTWSYRIIGCDDGFDLLFEITDFIVSKISEEELESYPKYIIPDKRYKEICASVYSDLIQFVESKKSRLAYMVLGLHLMMNGVRIDDDLKKKILEYSNWKYEKSQISDEKLRIQRKRNLAEFRAALVKYSGTGNDDVPLQIDTITSVINRKVEGCDSSPIKLKNIDYAIKGKEKD